MTDGGFISCNQPGCEGPTTGVCIENFSLDECPNVQRSAEAETDGQQGEAPPRPQLISIGSGPSLSVAGCDALLRQSGGHLVPLVGGHGVGKTTLLATGYELARRGLVQGHGFGGSETIRGYEERCHLARLASEGGKPDTLRTSSTLTFVHLRLRSSRATDLIFADRSGEQFERALDKPQTFLEFPELARARALFLLMDAARLSTSPHAEVSQTRRFFMALADMGLLDGRSVTLVATKLDAVAADKQADCTDRLNDVLAELRRRAPTTAEVDFQATAARARKGTTIFGEGIPELLSRFTKEPEGRSYTLHVPQAPASANAYERLRYRERR